MNFLAAISSVAVLLSEAITLGYKVVMLWREAQLKGWVKEGRTLSYAIENAKTEEERAILAKLLFEHTS